MKAETGTGRFIGEVSSPEKENAVSNNKLETAFSFILRIGDYRLDL